jgi:cell division transport system permease protein
VKSGDNKVLRRRLRSSYITSLISITLVLFMLGLVGLLVLNAREISVYVKENINISVYLKDHVRDAEIFRVRKIIDAEPFIKSTDYITKELAAKKFQEELGEDFVSFLGINPLLASIEIHLQAEYANADSIAKITKKLSAYPQVSEVDYQPSLVQTINNNISKISFFILAFCAMFFIVAVSLINNTVRLSIYSRRFNINTMQLVGATNSFIRKPFMYRSILQGFYGAIFANGMLLITLYWINNQMADVANILDYKIITLLFFLVIAIGILINIISTFFALNKFLKLRTEELYY